MSTVASCKDNCQTLLQIYKHITWQRMLIRQAQELSTLQFVRKLTCMTNLWVTMLVNEYSTWSSCKSNHNNWLKSENTFYQLKHLGNTSIRLCFFVLFFISWICKHNSLWIRRVRILLEIPSLLALTFLLWYWGRGETKGSVLFRGVFFLYIEYSTSNKNRTDNLRVTQWVQALVLFLKYM